jgi:nitronate monooxygenase
MSGVSTRVTEELGIEVPLFCGAMYPCSNPELVGAVSAAGALGVVQPLSLIYVHGRDLREGLKEIRELAGGRPIGFNAIVERSAKAYERRIRAWVDIALEEGVRFFVTALGNPSWVVDGAHSVGGVVYHDVTERKWADKALEAGVDGLICVNARAGGHAGGRSPGELLAELADIDVPKVCAGGVGDEHTFRAALDLGYDAVQMGTRFIATPECNVHSGYRDAICEADEEDIVLTDKLSGVPVSVIKTQMIERLGPNATGLARWLLKNRRTKHWMRTFYALRSVRNLKRSSLKGLSYKDVWQAGKSVAGIDTVLPAGEIVRRCARALED